MDVKLERSGFVPGTGTSSVVCHDQSVLAGTGGLIPRGTFLWSVDKRTTNQTCDSSKDNEGADLTFRPHLSRYIMSRVSVSCDSAPPTPTLCVAGEGMKVVASIQNNSSRDIKPKYCLYRKYSYFAKGKRRVETKDILKEVGEIVPPSASQTVTRIITIPPTTGVSILNCSILKAEHRLRVGVSLVRLDRMFTRDADCFSSAGVSGRQVRLRPRDQVPSGYPPCPRPEDRGGAAPLSSLRV